MHFRPRFVWCRLYSFAYVNAAMRTFVRAHKRRPYDFVWQIACRRLVSF